MTDTEWGEGRKKNNRRERGEEMTEPWEPMFGPRSRLCSC